MLLFLKPRSTPTMHHSSEAKLDTSVLAKPLFLSASFSNIFQGLAFFLPIIYLPSYAYSLSLTKTQPAVPLSLLNLSQIFGQIAIGYLSDHHSLYIPLFLSPFFSALSTLMLWGFAKSFGPLVVFSILYGIFSGGYSVLYCRFATSLSSERATGLWLYSIFDFQRGVGNIVGGVVSELLVKGEVVEVAYGVGRYEWLVLLVGGSMLVSSFGGLGWFIEDKKVDVSSVLELPILRENSIKDKVTE
jgi:MFS family permease